METSWITLWQDKYSVDLTILPSFEGEIGKLNEIKTNRNDEWWKSSLARDKSVLSF